MAAAVGNCCAKCETRPPHYDGVFALPSRRWAAPSTMGQALTSRLHAPSHRPPKIHSGPIAIQTGDEIAKVSIKSQACSLQLKHIAISLPPLVAEIVATLLHSPSNENNTRICFKNILNIALNTFSKTHTSLTFGLFGTI